MILLALAILLPAISVAESTYHLVGVYETMTSGYAGSQMSCSSAAIRATDVNVKVQVNASIIQSISLSSNTSHTIFHDILNRTIEGPLRFNVVGAATEMNEVRIGLLQQERGFVGLELAGGPQHPRVCAYMHWGIKFGPPYFAMSLLWDADGNSRCDSAGGTVSVEPSESYCAYPGGRRKSSLVAIERRVGWKAYPWSLCESQSTTCDTGLQTRQVTCSDNLQNQLPDSACNGLERPPSQQACVHVACENVATPPASVASSAIFSALPEALLGGWVGIYATRTTQAYCGRTMKRSVVDIEITQGDSGSTNGSLVQLPRLKMSTRSGIATPLPLVSDMLLSGTESGTAVYFMFEGIITGYDEYTGTLSVMNPAIPAAGSKALRFFPNVEGILGVREDENLANYHHLLEVGPGAALLAFSYDAPEMTSFLPGPNGTASCAPKDTPLLDDLWAAAPAGRVDFFRISRKSGQFQLGPFEECEPNVALGVCYARQSVLTDKCFFPNSTDEVDSALCDGASMPATVMRNCSACVAFELSEWSNCTAKCSGGVQDRTITCVKTSSASRPPQPLSTCSAILGTGIPADEQRCNIEPCASWVVGQWGACSYPCGPGQQTRTVECRELQSGKLIETNTYRRCGTEPVAAMACQMCPCEPTNQGVIEPVRIIPEALQTGALEDPKVDPLEPYDPASTDFVGYRSVNSSTFCGVGYELLTMDQFKCFPASFYRDLCARVYSRASPGSIPVAFKARDEDLPLDVPRWATAAGGLLEGYNPDIVLQASDSYCRFFELQHQDRAFVSPERQAAVGVCRTKLT